jgi:xylan 1,4-beta-xylosidase
VDVLVWNGTLDQSKIDGAPELDRTVTVDVSGLDPGTYTVLSSRIDEHHGNIGRVWRALGGGDWPTDEQWLMLHTSDTLPIEYLAEVAVDAEGVASVAVELPMPGIRSLRLTRR